MNRLLADEAPPHPFLRADEMHPLLAYDAELAVKNARANAPSMTEFLARMGRAVATSPSVQSLRSGATLPGDVYAGRTHMGLPSETEDLTRVADMAGLAMTGGTGGAAATGVRSNGATLGIVPIPVAKRLDMPVTTGTNELLSAG
jgi:hypothetical protein